MRYSGSPATIVTNRRVNVDNNDDQEDDGPMAGGSTSTNPLPSAASAPTLAPTSSSSNNNEKNNEANNDEPNDENKRTAKKRKHSNGGATNLDINKGKQKATTSYDIAELEDALVDVSTNLSNSLIKYLPNND